MAYLNGEYAQYTGQTNNREYDRFDPLLVTLHDHLKLFKADKTDTNLYSQVETSIVRLLEANLHPSDKTSVATIIIDIIKQACADMQRNLSEKLSARSNLHDSLLHYLAYEDIHIAEPVLKHSSQLSDTDILYIIQSKGKDHWAAIAQRQNISAAVIHGLINKCDSTTCMALLSNDTAILEHPHLKKIVDTHVPYSRDLADKLVSYKSLPNDLAVEIYWHVSNAMRSHLVEKFSLEKSVIDKALKDSMQDFADTSFGAETMKPSNLMTEIANEKDRNKTITDEMLVNTLRRRQGRFFIALFAKRTQLSHKIVWSMLKRSGGQGLAVACRASNIQKKDFVSIFLLTASLVKGRPAVGADELRMAIRYYESLTYKMAKEIMEDSVAIK